MEWRTLGFRGRLLRLRVKQVGMDDWTAGYQSLWEMRKQPLILTESWAESDWAKGRTDYITFMIRVEIPEIVEKAQIVQDGFRDFRCADPFPVEYLHLTVKETGCFLVDEKESDDEITGGGINQRARV